MTKLYVMLMVLLLAISACSDGQAEKAPTEAQGTQSVVDTDAETMDSSATERELLDAIEDLRTAYGETNRLLTEQNRLWEEALALGTPPTVASLPTVVTPTPLPEVRGDICDRSIPMQEKLLSLYPNVNLCAMVRLGELYRIERLSLDGDMSRLRGSDFAFMLNLRYLELRHDRNDAKGEPAVLAPDFFDELSGLETLSMSGDFGTAMLTNLPALPGMEGLSFGARVRFPDYEGGPVPDRILSPVRLPDMPNLRILELGVGGEGRGLIRLQIDGETFDGTSNLEAVTIDGNNDVCLEIASDAFEELMQLAALNLNGYPCGAIERQSDGSFDRDDEYRTFLVVANRAVAQGIRDRDQCYGQCVVVARNEVS